MSFKRITVYLTIIALLALPVSGCTKKPVKSEGTLNFRLMADPVSLDPARAYDTDSSMQVVTQVFDGLVDYDPQTMEVIPAVAEDWEMDETATKFTFNLKKGVKFHNGTEVTAKDFKYAWDRVVDPETASELIDHFSGIKGFDDIQEKKAKSLEGVKVIDDYKLEVELSQPNADFITMLGHPVFSPVPKSEVSKSFSEKPVGNGPFEIEKWVRGKEVKTNAFKDYYREIAKVAKVTYKIINDDNTALKEFKAGNIDFTYIPVGQLEKLKGDSSVKVEISPLLATYYYGFDTTKEPWDKNLVRQALNYAVDRSSIVEKYAENAVTPAYSLIPEGMPGYRSDVTDFSYNPEKAKKLLKEAGYPGGRGFPDKTLIYEEGLGHDIVAQIFQQNLKEIGISIRVQGLESGAFWDQIDEKKGDFFKLTWAADYPIMDSFLSPLYSSESSMNISGYSSKDFDQKLTGARATFAEKGRISLFQQAEDILMDDAPFIPLFYQTNRYVINKNISGVKFSPLGFVDTSKVVIGDLLDG